MSKVKKSNTIKQKLQPKYILKLYVVGTTPNSMNALQNLKKICETYVPGNYSIKTIDLLLLPELAKEDHILAIPTVIRKSPKPIRKAIGDLSNTEGVLNELDLH